MIIASGIFSIHFVEVFVKIYDRFHSGMSRKLCLVMHKNNFAALCLEVQVRMARVR